MAIDKINPYIFQNPYIEQVNSKKASANPFAPKAPIDGQSLTHKIQQNPQKGYAEKFANGEISVSEAIEILNKFKPSEKNLSELENDKFLSDEYNRMQKEFGGRGELVSSIASGENRILNSSWYKTNPEGIFA